MNIHQTHNVDLLEIENKKLKEEIIDLQIKHVETLLNLRRVTCSPMNKKCIYNKYGNCNAPEVEVSQTAFQIPNLPICKTYKEEIHIIDSCPCNTCEELSCEKPCDLFEVWTKEK